MTLDEALVQLEEDVALLRIVAGELQLRPADESEIISASGKIHNIYEAIEECCLIESSSSGCNDALLTKLGVPGYE
jgi:hypothetical protein